MASVAQGASDGRGRSAIRGTSELTRFARSDRSRRSNDARRGSSNGRAANAARDSDIARTALGAIAFGNRLRAASDPERENRCGRKRGGLLPYPIPQATCKTTIHGTSRHSIYDPLWNRRKVASTINDDVNDTLRRTLPTKRPHVALVRGTRAAIRTIGQPAKRRLPTPPYLRCWARAYRRTSLSSGDTHNSADRRTRELECLWRKIPPGERHFLSIPDRKSTHRASIDVSDYRRISLRASACGSLLTRATLMCRACTIALSRSLQ